MRYNEKIEDLLKQSVDTGLPVLPLGENWPINVSIDQFKRLQKMHSLRRMSDQPWLVINFIGCVPVFGHFDASCKDFWGMSQDFGFKVLLKLDEYLELYSAYQDGCNWEKTDETLENYAPQLDTTESVYEYIIESKFWRIDERVRGLDESKVISAYQSYDHIKWAIDAIVNQQNMIPLTEISVSQEMLNVIGEKFRIAFDALCYNKVDNTYFVLMPDAGCQLLLQDTLNSLREESSLVRIHATYAPLKAIERLMNDGVLEEKIHFPGEDVIESKNGQKVFHCDRFMLAELTEGALTKDPRHALAFIIRRAVKENASDIHIEEFEGKLAIRYRRNTFLNRKYTFPIKFLSRLNSIISQYGGMDSLKKLVPQSGRFSAVIRDISYEIRVSMIPMKEEQSCVLRIHGAKDDTLALDSINLNSKDSAIFHDALTRKSGIILVTGPTGSGKSTTLYAALAELNTEDISIETIEDPVERYIEGVKQFQVRYSQDSEKSLTFPKLFREVLRHDPDVIMVGEIRDLETANQAIIAAQTGHLVLSTLHTQDSLGAIPRLISEGVNPQYLADSLIMVEAQRLIGTVCKNCRTPVNLSSAEGKVVLDEFKKEEIVYKENEPIYSAGKCEHCKNTGYEGKHAIFEVFPIVDEVKGLIASGANIHSVRKLGDSVGYRTLYQEGLQHVAMGLTTYEEAFKYRRESKFDYQELLQKSREELRSSI